jgi:hypothetical protein
MRTPIRSGLGSARPPARRARRVPVRPLARRNAELETVTVGGTDGTPGLAPKAPQDDDVALTKCRSMPIGLAGRSSQLTPSESDKDRPARVGLAELRLRVAPQLADSIGALEVGEEPDVEQYGSSRRWERLQAAPKPT